jgi:hypothetical protein
LQWKHVLRERNLPLHEAVDAIGAKILAGMTLQSSTSKSRRATSNGGRSILRPRWRGGNGSSRRRPCWTRTNLGDGRQPAAAVRPVPGVTSGAGRATRGRDCATGRRAVSGIPEMEPFAQGPLTHSRAAAGFAASTPETGTAWLKRGTRWTDRSQAGGGAAPSMRSLQAPRSYECRQRGGSAFHRATIQSRCQPEACPTAPI